MKQLYMTINHLLTKNGGHSEIMWSWKWSLSFEVT